jgi:hypothetical protein
MRLESWAVPGLRLPRLDSLLIAGRFVGLLLLSILVFCGSLVGVGFLLNQLVRAIF